MAPGQLGEALAERRGLRPRLRPPTLPPWWRPAGPGTAGAVLRD
ncbi:ATIC isoform 11 [Pan troglodytes]|uniref:ATIC isoform 11 n=1 Tax=Pan troglodytes TaxID=9598 RepID=A0A2J8NGZ6_PANTR|nr:ATIC isoform 3 [Pan troglodytes]PNI71041.1 ATIC isoform 11 [Pan troglodytes]